MDVSGTSSCGSAQRTAGNLARGVHSRADRQESPGESPGHAVAKRAFWVHRLTCGQLSGNTVEPAGLGNTDAVLERASAHSVLHARHKSCSFVE